MPMIRMAFRGLLLLVALGAVSVCGYRPLYGTNADGSNVSGDLAGIKVEEQRTRTGQLVRNELLSALGRSADGTSPYALKLEPEEKIIGVSVIVGQKLERKRYRLNVKYSLLSTSTGQIVTQGSSFSNVSYDTVREPIADLQASENARNRATREVAEDIRLRLSAFLATSHGS